MTDSCFVDYRRYKGGHSKSGFSRCFAAWNNMRNRCLNPNHPEYLNYGGRGITIDARWEDFDVFFHDMGHPPDKHSLERLENDQGYSIDNCVWAMIGDQNRNRRDNIFITLNGETLCVTDWSLRLGIPKSTICGRYHRGLSPEKILEVHNLDPMRNIRIRRDRGTYAVSITVLGIQHRRTFRDLADAQSYRDELDEKRRSI